MSTIFTEILKASHNNQTSIFAFTFKFKLNYLSSVILIAAVTCLGDAPNSDLAFNVFKPYNIAGKPKPSKDYQLEKSISRFEYRFGSIILVHTH